MAKKKEAEVLFIIYTNGVEAIVTTPALEKRTLKFWFKDTGRNIENFQRLESIIPGICTRPNTLIELDW